jgi:hypothetical protein
MLKRVRWLTTGVAVGVGTSMWLQRRLRTAAQRYRPASLAGGAATRVRDALDEGRRAMRQREAELRGGAGGRREGRPRP